jgi:stage III sporulation protein AD
MSLSQIIALALVAAALCIILRPIRPELALLLSLAAGVVIIMTLFGDIRDVLYRMRSMADRAAIPGAYMEILIKALGICFLTQIAVDACKDAGEGSVASKIEMAGKLAVIVISLPLFEQVLSVVFGLVSNG